MPAITYNSHQVNYFTQGYGPKILFLHGWPTNSRLWDAQVEALQSDYQTITIDWLGFGESDKPENHTYTFTSMKEILDELIGNLLEEGEKITLIGHDIGGPPAILWSDENQEKVERLILLNTILFPLKTPLDRMSEIMMETPLIRNVFVSPFGLKRVMKSVSQSRGKSLNQSIKTILEPYKGIPANLKRRTLTQPMSIGRKNEILTLSNTFKELTIPRYLILAEKDPLCYAHINKLSQENPEIPAYRIPDCGHYIAIDRPDELNEILSNILKKDS